MQWGIINWESVKENRILDEFEVTCDYRPCRGCIAEVVKGRKFPIGMKFAVSGFYTKNTPVGTKCYLEFYDVGFRKVSIDGENVKIVAYDREDNPEEYRNVHNVEVCF